MGGTFVRAVPAVHPVTCEKQPYPYQKVAEGALRKIRLQKRRNMAKGHKIPDRAYRCTVKGCGKWHLTSEVRR